MAADSQVGISSEGGGDRMYRNCRKVFSIEGEFIGGAGDSDGIHLWFEWYMDGCDDKRTFKLMCECDFDIVILHEDGRIESSGPYGIFEDIEEQFYAIGSGTKAALAAMYMGADAEKAIEIAKLIDPHTGGPVKVYRH
jgi:ATP-dependent protease HslVU (ClpYQ) peptidase subunit